MIAGRPNGLLDLCDRQIGDARRQTGTTLGRGSVGFGQRLTIRIRHSAGIAGGTRIAAIVDVAAAGVSGRIVRCVAIVGAEIRARREDAGEQEIGAVRPERIVIVVGPEGEGKDISVQVRPENRAGPAAEAMAPTISASAPKAAPPAIPVMGIAEGVAVESGVIEIVQAAEVAGYELIVRQLIVHELIVSETIMGERIVPELVVRELAARVHLIGAAKLRMSGGRVVGSGDALAGRHLSDIARLRESLAADWTSGERMTTDRAAAERLPGKAAVDAGETPTSRVEPAAAYMNATTTTAHMNASASAATAHVESAATTAAVKTATSTPAAMPAMLR